MAVSIENSNGILYGAIKSIDDIITQGLSCSCCDDEPNLSYAIRKFRFFIGFILFSAICYATLFTVSGFLLSLSKVYKQLDLCKPLDVRQRLAAFVHASINAFLIIGYFYVNWNFIWNNPIYGQTPKAFIFLGNSAGYFIYDSLVEITMKPLSKWRKDILLHHTVYFLSTFLLFYSCAGVFMTMIGTLVVISDATNHAIFLNYTFGFNLEKILLPIKDFMTVFRLVIPNLPFPILIYDLFITGNFYRLHEKGRGNIAILFVLIMGTITFLFSYFWTPKKKKPQQMNGTHHTNGINHNNQAQH